MSTTITLYHRDKPKAQLTAEETKGMTTWWLAASALLDRAGLLDYGVVDRTQRVTFKLVKRDASGKPVAARIVTAKLDAATAGADLAIDGKSPVWIGDELVAA